LSIENIVRAIAREEIAKALAAAEERAPKPRADKEALSPVDAQKLYGLSLNALSTIQGPKAGAGLF
jgi:hypothetical protein